MVNFRCCRRRLIRADVCAGSARRRAWDGLAAELGLAAESFGLVTSGLAGGHQRGARRAVAIWWRRRRMRGGWLRGAG